MCEIFRQQVNWQSLFDSIVARGGVFEPHSLSVEFIEQLLAEVESLEYQLHVSTNTRVREFYHKSAQIGTDVFSPLIAKLAGRLAWQLRLVMGRKIQLSAWQPNDVEVHKYTNPEVGISPHRDFSDNKLLIASFTLAGYGQFEYHGKEEVQAPSVWETGPGSMILMQAAGFNPANDFRPVHAVRGPRYGERTSIIYWMSERKFD